MCVRRCELALLLGLAACATQPDQLLTEVEEGLAQEAALASGQAVTGTLLVTAAAVEACAGQAGLWDEVAVGDPAPMEDILATALGEPTVASLSRTSASVAILELEGVDLLGWEEGRLRLNAEGDGQAMSLSFTFNAEGARVGEGSFEILAGCADVARASGSAEWTDADGRDHALSFPLSPGASLFLGGAAPWLPTQGDLGWSALVREVASDAETVDATELVVDESGELPAAEWSATIRSQGWSAQAVIPISL